MAEGIKIVRKGVLYSILSVLFLDNFGLSLVYPIFSSLILYPEFGFLPHIGTYHMRIIYLSILTVSFPLAQFFGAPFFGTLADKNGRKKAFFFTLAGETIGYVLSAIAIVFRNYSLLLSSRFLTGFFAGNLTICLASVSDMYTAPSARRKRFGLLAMVAGVSFILAIAIGGGLSNTFLYHFFNPSLPFWITATFSILNFIIIAFFFHDLWQKRAKKLRSFWAECISLIAIFHYKNIQIYYYLFFLFMFGWASTLQYLSAYLIENYDASKLLITYTFLSVSCFWVLSNTLIHRFLIKKMAPQSIVPVAFFFFFASLSIATMSQKYLLFVIALSIGSIFGALIWSNLLSLISLEAPIETQGKILGINQSISIIALIMAPILGALFGQISTKAIYTCSSFSLLIAFIITIILKNKFKNKNNYANN